MRARNGTTVFTVPVAPSSQDFTNQITTNPPPGTKFPRAGDTAALDGTHYYRFSAGSGIIGSMTIIEKCVWIFAPTASVTNLSTGSSDSISINPTATLDIYAYGNIEMRSSSAINEAKDARKLNIYGTNPALGGQTFTMESSTKISACLYMPNANVTMSSSSDICGALVANELDMSSSAKFHFDESITGGGGASAVTPQVGVQATKWKELRTAAERQTYTAVLNF